MTAAVHHQLVRERTRMEVGLVVESGDCREVHHVALLLGYGAAAVNPYLAFESVEDLIRTGTLTGVQPAQAVRNVRSEEHTSELQSRQYLVCRLLLEKKKNNTVRHKLQQSISQ